jgi:hypothetical protein
VKGGASEACTFFHRYLISADELEQKIKDTVDKDSGLVHKTLREIVHENTAPTLRSERDDFYLLSAFLGLRDDGTPRVASAHGQSNGDLTVDLRP